MTNVFNKPEKVAIRARLFEAGIEALRGKGFSVERIAGVGKSSVRRITKAGESRIVSIRTTQDMWIAFPRNEEDSEWATLSEVDAVVAVSVDSREHPRFAQVHLIEGDDMRDRFDRAYAARKKADYVIPVGRGVWVSLYDRDAKDPVTHVGGGAGLDNPAFARIPLDPEEIAEGGKSAKPSIGATDEFLTIAEAKRRLALTFGVSPASVKITVEG